MLKNKIIAILKDLEETNRQLFVEWNAGGDEASIWFKNNEEVISWPYKGRYAEVLEKFSSYLMQKLDLPCAGMQYSNGNGKIFLNNDNVFIEYDDILVKDHEESTPLTLVDLKLNDKIHEIIADNKLEGEKFDGNTTSLNGILDSIVEFNEKHHLELEGFFCSFIERNLLESLSINSSSFELYFEGTISVDKISLIKIELNEFETVHTKVKKEILLFE